MIMPLEPFGLLTLCVPTGLARKRVYGQQSQELHVSWRFASYLSASVLCEPKTPNLNSNIFVYFFHRARLAMRAGKVSGWLSQWTLKCARASNSQTIELNYYTVVMYRTLSGYEVSSLTVTPSALQIVQLKLNQHSKNVNNFSWMFLQCPLTLLNELTRNFWFCFMIGSVARPKGFFLWN